MKYKLLGLLCAISLFVGQSYAVGASVGDRVPLKAGELTTKQKVITVPANTELPIMTTYELNSNELLTGQTVTVAIPENFTHNGVLIAPKGSVLTGNIIEAKKARQNGTDGKLNIRFSLITTPYGLQIPIVAKIKTSDLSGILVGNSQQQQQQNAEVGSMVKKAKSNNIDLDENFLKTIWNFGENVVVPPKTNMKIVLTQPITITPIEFK